MWYPRLKYKTLTPGCDPEVMPAGGDSGRLAGGGVHLGAASGAPALTWMLPPSLPSFLLHSLPQPHTLPFHAICPLSTLTLPPHSQTSLSFHSSFYTLLSLLFIRTLLHFTTRDLSLHHSSYSNSYIFISFQPSHSSSTTIHAHLVFSSALLLHNLVLTR